LRAARDAKLHNPIHAASNAMKSSPASANTSDRNEQPCGGGEESVEALGENQTAVRLCDDEHREKRPTGFIKREPERNEEREKCRREGFHREHEGEERVTFSRNKRDRDFGARRFAYPHV
jgi:hypothetical protein